MSVALSMGGLLAALLAIFLFFFFGRGFPFGEGHLHQVLGK